MDGAALMICARCQAENPEAARFCGQCGAVLAAACTSCGTANPPQNRFCSHCGAALADAAGAQNTADAAAAEAPTGEFKQVTVLFCDLVGSTNLTERIGAEALHDLLRRFLDAAIGEVRRYGGSAPQFTGDGFMGLFGAPVAHEDHAQRALLAAVAVRRLVGPSAADPDMAGLSIRIGINSGLVVFGAVADRLRMDHTVVGDTANIGARLQAVAEPGGIVIGAATLALTRGFARVEPVGALTLKGVSAPVGAYRLLDVSSRPGGDDTTRGGSRVFVGRGGELTALHERLRRAEAGSGQAVGICGEPGVGKSRLAAEFRRSPAARETGWIEGRCVSYGSGIPYQLMLDMLRSACRIADADAPPTIASKVRSGLRTAGLHGESDGALLLDLLGVDAGQRSPAAAANPETVKTRAFEIFRQVAIRTSRRRPLVLFVEDLHWLDKVSEDFLRSLLDTLPDERILLLATYRSGYRPPWLGSGVGAEIALDPLSREDSDRVLRAVLDRRELPDRIFATILGRAEGNPFFIEQLALHIGEEAGPSAAEAVPNTIRDVVMARIDRLPAATKRLLQTASVVGRRFSLRLLREVWQGLEPIAAQLAELTRLEFLQELPELAGPSYVFRHALTQDAAYAGLLARDRRRTHARVGRALEQLFRDRTDEVTELLALHWGRDDDQERAVDYAIAAAEKAQRRWANTEALSYFDDALQRLTGMPDIPANRLRRVDAVLDQIEVKLALGRHAEHIDALAAIRDMVEETGDPRRRTTWHYWTGFLHSLTGGDPGTAIEHCRRAAEIAAEAGFDELDGHIQSCLAQAYTVAGELHPAIEAGERAVSIFEARGDRWYAGRALWHLSTASNYLGNWEASLAYCARAYAHGVALDDSRLKGITLWRTGSAHIQRGDPEEGLRLCEESLRLAPAPYDSIQARSLRGYGLVKEGQLDAGIAELRDARAWFGKSHLHYSEAIVSLWLVEGLLLKEDTEEARGLAEQVVAAATERGYVNYEALAYRLLGESLVCTAPLEAEAHIDRALRIFEATGARNDKAKALVTKARLHLLQGDGPTVTRLLREAFAIFRELGTLQEPARVEAILVELG